MQTFMRTANYIFKLIISQALHIEPAAKSSSTDQLGAPTLFSAAISMSSF